MWIETTCYGHAMIYTTSFWAKIQSLSITMALWRTIMRKLTGTSLLEYNEYYTASFTPRLPRSFTWGMAECRIWEATIALAYTSRPAIIISMRRHLQYTTTRYLARCCMESTASYFFGHASKETCQETIHPQLMEWRTAGPDSQT